MKQQQQQHLKVMDNNNKEKKQQERLLAVCRKSTQLERDETARFQTANNLWRKKGNTSKIFLIFSKDELVLLYVMLQIC